MDIIGVKRAINFLSNQLILSVKEFKILLGLRQELKDYKKYNDFEIKQSKMNNNKSGRIY